LCAAFRRLVHRRVRWVSGEGGCGRVCCRGCRTDARSRSEAGTEASPSAPGGAGLRGGGESGPKGVCGLVQPGPGCNGWPPVVILPCTLVACLEAARFEQAGMVGRQCLLHCPWAITPLDAITPTPPGLHGCCSSSSSSALAISVIWFFTSNASGMQRPADAVLLHGQGNVQMRLGHFGRALASYRRAADLAPGVRARAPRSIVQRACLSLHVCL